MTAEKDPGDMPGIELLRGAATYEGVLVGSGGREIGGQRQVKGGAEVYAAIYSSPPYALSVPGLAVPRLSVNLTPARVSGGVEGESPRHFVARRHSLFLTPADAPVIWRKEAPSRHLAIYFQPDLFDGGEESPMLSSVPFLFNANMAGIGVLVGECANELQGSGELNSEAADSLARLLLIRLARHLRSANQAPHALAPKVIARLRDYVIAHLGERILVADLAEQTGLSPNRFALTFSEQTGRPPHKFVLALRVERAVEMLSRTQASLADIASACGFASQQHMSNTLRRHLGVTPSRLRAQHRR